jgi:hypothetical protein
MDLDSDKCVGLSAKVNVHRENDCHFSRPVDSAVERLSVGSAVQRGWYSRALSRWRTGVRVVRPRVWHAIVLVLVSPAAGTKRYFSTEGDELSFVDVLETRKRAVNDCTHWLASGHAKGRHLVPELCFDAPGATYRGNRCPGMAVMSVDRHSGGARKIGKLARRKRSRVKDDAWCSSEHEQS